MDDYCSLDYSYHFYCDYCGKEYPLLFTNTLPLGNTDDTSPFILDDKDTLSFSENRLTCTLCDDCYPVVERVMKNYQRHSLGEQAREYVKFCKFAKNHNAAAHTISKAIGE